MRRSRWFTFCSSIVVSVGGRQVSPLTLIANNSPTWPAAAENSPEASYIKASYIRAALNDSGRPKLSDAMKRHGLWFPESLELTSAMAGLGGLGRMTYHSGWLPVVLGCSMLVVRSSVSIALLMQEAYGPSSAGRR